MVARELCEGVLILRGEPHPDRDVVHELGARDGVIAGVSLPEIVQPSAEQQQVGPRDAIAQLRGLDRRLHEVPVNGEAVVGVVLGFAPHRLPLGEDARQQSVLIERLEHRDRGWTRRKQIEEGRRRVRRPRITRPRCAATKLLEGSACDRHATLRGRRGNPEHE